MNTNKFQSFIAQGALISAVGHSVTITTKAGSKSTSVLADLEFTNIKIAVGDQEQTLKQIQTLVLDDGARLPIGSIQEIEIAGE